MVIEVMKNLPTSLCFKLSDFVNSSFIKYRILFSNKDSEILEPEKAYKNLNSATSGEADSIFDWSLADYLKKEIAKLFAWIGDVTEPFIDYSLRSSILLCFLVMYLSDDYKGKTCRTMIILCFLYITYWFFRG